MKITALEKCHSCEKRKDCPVKNLGSDLRELRIKAFNCYVPVETLEIEIDKELLKQQEEIKTTNVEPCQICTKRKDCILAKATARIRSMFFQDDDTYDCLVPIVALEIEADLLQKPEDYLQN
jgi:hypothetical protein